MLWFNVCSEDLKRAQQPYLKCDVTVFMFLVPMLDSRGRIASATDCGKRWHLSTSKFICHSFAEEFRRYKSDWRTCLLSSFLRVQYRMQTSVGKQINFWVNILDNVVDVNEKEEWTQDCTLRNCWCHGKPLWGCVIEYHTLLVSLSEEVFNPFKTVQHIPTDWSFNERCWCWTESKALEKPRMI